MTVTFCIPKVIFRTANGKLNNLLFRNFWAHAIIYGAFISSFSNGSNNLLLTKTPYEIKH